MKHLYEKIIKINNKVKDPGYEVIQIREYEFEKLKKYIKYK